MATSESGALCYTIQEVTNGPLSLCVMDREAQKFHVFPLSIANASRLAAECSAAVNSAIGDFSEKHAFQEIAKLLAVQNDRLSSHSGDD